MADTRAATGLTPQIWDDKFYTQYLQENRFARYMGTDENSIIQVKEDLTKMAGKSITFALVNRLVGAGVTGTQTLEGNEEDLRSRSQAISVAKRRHGVVVPEQEEQYSAISLREAGRAMLKDWLMENTRDTIIRNLGSIDGVPYASASSTQRNAWLTNNTDRILFGSQKSNSSSGVHSTSLANVDNTADKLTSASLELLKRMALEASPKIRPISIKGDQRRYVVFAGTRTFRDLKKDATLMQAQRDAMPREKDNILFTGGDLYWDGMVIHEIDDMPVYTGVGASGIDVSPVYLCGAQAVGYAVAKRTTFRGEERDYGDKKGVAVELIDGFDKLRFGTGVADTQTLKDNGIVTGYFAAVADA